MNSSGGHHLPPVTGTTVSRADLIIDALSPLLTRAKRMWAERCQERGLSVTHFQVLAVLDGGGPLSMSRLADLMGVSLPNATGIISRMEERGVVVRMHDATDRRRVLVGLTDGGRDIAREMSDLHRRQLTALIQAMAPEQQENLLRAIRDVTAIVEQASSPPAT